MKIIRADLIEAGLLGRSINRFDFAMRVERQAGLFILRSDAGQAPA